LVQWMRTDPGMRVLDQAAEAAGGIVPVGAFRAGSGGSILTRLRMRDGSEAMLRVGATDGAADPSRGGEALRWLASAGVPAVPRALGCGRSGGAHWTLESRLPGERAGRPNDAMLQDVARFCARLPAGSGPPAAATEDIGRIAAAFPRHASLLATASSFLRPVLRALPPVARHGDLWSGNILIDRGTFTWIVDWDHSRPPPLAAARAASMMCSPRWSGPSCEPRAARRQGPTGPGRDLGVHADAARQRARHGAPALAPQPLPGGGVGWRPLHAGQPHPDAGRCRAALAGGTPGRHRPYQHRAGSATDPAARELPGECGACRRRARDRS